MQRMQQEAQNRQRGRKRASASSLISSQAAGVREAMRDPPAGREAREVAASAEEEAAGDVREESGAWGKYFPQALAVTSSDSGSHHWARA